MDKILGQRKTRWNWPIATPKIVEITSLVCASIKWRRYRLLVYWTMCADFTTTSYSVYGCHLSQLFTAALEHLRHGAWPKTKIFYQPQPMPFGPINRCACKQCDLIFLLILLLTVFLSFGNGLKNMENECFSKYAQYLDGIVDWLGGASDNLGNADR